MVLCLQLGEPWKMRKEAWEPRTLGIKSTKLFAEKVVGRLHSITLSREIKKKKMPEIK